jgi:hypothetical protein
MYKNTRKPQQNLDLKAERSALDLKKWVWPVIKSALGEGELIGVEGTAFDKFKFKLDRIAGIDAFQVDKTGSRMRGLACRVQYTNRCFESFSVRKSLGNSKKSTEFDKRFLAVNSPGKGLIFPHLTVHAYIENRSAETTRPRLLAVAVCRTTDLIKLCAYSNAITVRVNPSDWSEFFVVGWDLFKKKSEAMPILILGAQVEAFYSGESFKI